MLTVETIDEALSAHSEWKRRLMQMIWDDKGEFTVEMVAAANKCEFDRWLNNAAAMHGQPNHERIRKLHSDVHLEASRVLALVISGRRSEAEEAIGPGSVFATLSGLLAFALDQWRFEIRLGCLPL